jgi:hypothetical protein
MKLASRIAVEKQTIQKCPDKTVTGGTGRNDSGKTDAISDYHAGFCRGCDKPLKKPVTGTCGTAGFVGVE